MKFTPQMKLAMFIAPFLLVGGYIAGDYYEEMKAASKNLFQLESQGPCNLLENRCELKHGELVLQLKHRSGITTLSANNKIESATLSFTDKAGEESQFRLKTDPDGLIWEAGTNYSTISQGAESIKMRLIVTLNKAFYFSELNTTLGAP